jgi:hypothetical protein
MWVKSNRFRVDSQAGPQINPALLLTKSYMGVIIEMLHNFEVPEQPISGIPKLVLAMSMVEWRVILPDYQQPSITN